MCTSGLLYIPRKQLIKQITFPETNKIGAPWKRKFLLEIGAMLVLGSVIAFNLFIAIILKLLKVIFLNTPQKGHLSRHLSFFSGDFPPSG